MGTLTLKGKTEELKVFEPLLALEFPDLADLVCYQALEEIRPALLGWLERQI